jgi:hypothetical protein
MMAHALLDLLGTALSDLIKYLLAIKIMIMSVGTSSLGL